MKMVVDSPQAMEDAVNSTIQTRKTFFLPNWSLTSREWQCDDFTDRINRDGPAGPVQTRVQGVTDSRKGRRDDGRVDRTHEQRNGADRKRSDCGQAVVSLSGRYPVRSFMLVARVRQRLAGVTELPPMGSGSLSRSLIASSTE